MTDKQVKTKKFSFSYRHGDSIYCKQFTVSENVLVDSVTIMSVSNLRPQKYQKAFCNDEAHICFPIVRKVNANDNSEHSDKL